MLDTIADTFKLPVNHKLFFGGKTNMLRQPEFHDLEKIRRLMNMIEQEDRIYDLIRKNPVGINVKIGRENNNTEMENCSLITATYSVGQKNLVRLRFLVQPEWSIPV